MIFFLHMYITIDNLFCICFWKFWSSSFFVVIILIQFCVILVRNGMFYSKQRSSNLVTIFYYVIDTMYIYSWKEIDEILTHFGHATYQSKFFLAACGVQLDNGVTPPPPVPSNLWWQKNLRKVYILLKMLHVVCK